MVDKKTQQWSGCPVRFSMSQFGDKWSFIILRDLMFKGRQYYQEFLDAGEGISTNILADRLANLEANGLINKRTDKIKKSKYVYSLTGKGIELMPMMLEMINWAEKYDKSTEVPKDFVRQLRTDPQRLQEKLLEEIPK